MDRRASHERGQVWMGLRRHIAGIREITQANYCKAWRCKKAASRWCCAFKSFAGAEGKQLQAVATGGGGGYERLRGRATPSYPYHTLLVCVSITAGFFSFFLAGLAAAPSPPIAVGPSGPVAAPADALLRMCSPDADIGRTPSPAPAVSNVMSTRGAHAEAGRGPNAWAAIGLPGGGKSSARIMGSGFPIVLIRTCDPGGGQHARAVQRRLSGRGQCA